MNDNFRDNIERLDNDFKGKNKGDYGLPIFDGVSYYKDVAKAPYFYALTILRHYIKKACDIYWGDIQKAFNIDLFMITQSVSSPMGPGSDSKAISIKFGNDNSFLVDSSQFGFEPLLLNGIEKVYCYLPSMRDEDPNKRHLNQFYHCEAEIVGTLEDLKPQIENFIKFLVKTVNSMPNILSLLSTDIEISTKKIDSLLATQKFQEIEFDDVIKILIGAGFGNLVRKTEFGYNISCDGELKLMEILHTDSPIWVNHYDRDGVAFYQKPYNQNKVINADLLFPPLMENSFGGEVVGSGQRQDDPEEMYESLKRQGVESKPYE
ncbi:MAG: amino acid--tRNA ligase-related protein, partial [Candidatus Shapirobacteria bacterium]